MNSVPITIHEMKMRFFLGLVSIRYVIEDRRPDLKEYKLKFKHLITICIMRKRFSWVLRTAYSYDEQPFINER